MNFRCVSPKGETRWLSWGSSVQFRRHAGLLVPAWVNGACFDITEHKESESRIEMLLRESNHRFRNMLSVVMSIARFVVARSLWATTARYWCARSTDIWNASSAATGT